MRSVVTLYLCIVGILLLSDRKCVGIPGNVYFKMGGASYNFDIPDAQDSSHGIEESIAPSGSEIKPKTFTADKNDFDDTDVDEDSSGEYYYIYVSESSSSEELPGSLLAKESTTSKPKLAAFPVSSPTQTPKQTSVKPLESRNTDMDIRCNSIFAIFNQDCDGSGLSSESRNISKTATKPEGRSLPVVQRSLGASGFTNLLSMLPLNDLLASGNTRNNERFQLHPFFTRSSKRGTGSGNHQFVPALSVPTTRMNNEFRAKTYHELAKLNMQLGRLQRYGGQDRGSGHNYKEDKMENKRYGNAMNNQGHSYNDMYGDMKPHHYPNGDEQNVGSHNNGEGEKIPSTGGGWSHNQEKPDHENNGQWKGSYGPNYHSGYSSQNSYKGNGQDQYGNGKSSDWYPPQNKNPNGYQQTEERYNEKEVLAGPHSSNAEKRLWSMNSQNFRLRPWNHNYNGGKTWVIVRQDPFNVFKSYGYDRNSNYHGESGEIPGKGNHQSYGSQANGPNKEESGHGSSYKVTKNDYGTQRFNYNVNDRNPGGNKGTGGNVSGGPGSYGKPSHGEKGTESNGGWTQHDQHGNSGGHIPDRAKGYQAQWSTSSYGGRNDKKGDGHVHSGYDGNFGPSKVNGGNHDREQGTGVANGYSKGSYANEGSSDGGNGYRGSSNEQHGSYGSSYTREKGSKGYGTSQNSGESYRGNKGYGNSENSNGATQSNTSSYGESKGYGGSKSNAQGSNTGQSHWNGDGTGQNQEYGSNKGNAHKGGYKQNGAYGGTEYISSKPHAHNYETTGGAENGGSSGKNVGYDGSGRRKQNYEDNKASKGYHKGGNNGYRSNEGGNYGYRNKNDGNNRYGKESASNHAYENNKDHSNEYGSNKGVGNKGNGNGGNSGYGQHSGGNGAYENNKGSSNGYGNNNGGNNGYGQHSGGNGAYGSNKGDKNGYGSNSGYGNKGNGNGGSSGYGQHSGENGAYGSNKGGSNGYGNANGSNNGDENNKGHVNNNGSNGRYVSNSGYGQDTGRNSGYEKTKGESNGGRNGPRNNTGGKSGYRNKYVGNNGDGNNNGHISEYGNNNGGKNNDGNSYFENVYDCVQSPCKESNTKPVDSSPQEVSYSDNRKLAQEYSSIFSNFLVQLRRILNEGLKTSAVNRESPRILPKPIAPVAANGNRGKQKPHEKFLDRLQQNNEEKFEPTDSSPGGSGKFNPPSTQNFDIGSNVDKPFFQSANLDFTNPNDSENTKFHQQLGFFINHTDDSSNANKNPSLTAINSFQQFQDGQADSPPGVSPFLPFGNNQQSNDFQQNQFPPLKNHQQNSNFADISELPQQGNFGQRITSSGHSSTFQHQNVDSFFIPNENSSPSKFTNIQIDEFPQFSKTKVPQPQSNFPQTTNISTSQSKPDSGINSPQSFKELSSSDSPNAPSDPNASDVPNQFFLLRRHDAFLRKSKINQNRPARTLLRTAGNDSSVNKTFQFSLNSFTTPTTLGNKFNLTSGRSKNLSSTFNSTRDFSSLFRSRQQNITPAPSLAEVRTLKSTLVSISVKGLDGDNNRNVDAAYKPLALSSSKLLKARLTSSS